MGEAGRAAGAAGMGKVGRAAGAARMAVAALALASAGAPVAARVQPYQIVRLLTYKSSCQIQRVEDRSPASGPMRFFASCENASFYPDGIEIVCDDRDDDRSCHITTKERSFDHLKSLMDR